MERNRNLFWELVEGEHLKARGFCRKLIGNRQDGDDLYQDSLVTALSKFDSLREINSFRPWFYRIIVNHFKNTIRRPWWTKITPMTKEISESLGGKDPFDAYSARQRLEVAFKVLKPEDQTLVTLFELEGWSIAELAESYDKNIGVIKMRLSRSRAKMRNALMKASPSTKKEAVKIFKTEDRICVATKPGKN